MNSRSKEKIRTYGAAAVRSLIPTPMQTAMVFASVRDPGAGNYVQQLRIKIREHCLGRHWHQAFEVVTQRHDILRASFDLAAENGPEISIADTAPVLFEEHDLIDRSSAEQNRTLREYLETNRRTGFATEKAPLMRLALFHFGEQDHELVWTSHHALFDGRGRYIVLREVTEVYDAIVDDREPVLEPPVPYAPFLDWMANRETVADETYWKSKLAGLYEIPSIRSTESGILTVEGDDRNVLRQSLGSNIGESLEKFAKSIGVTVNTVVQGAWALVLARLSGQEEVVFGAPRACRHGSVPGAGEMVGVMVNTVPIRIKVDSGMKVESFLRELRELWVEMRPFEHAPLTLMRRVAELSPEQPLFESLVGFEGYELTDRLRQDDRRWEKREATLEARTELPLTLQLYRSPEWDFVLTFDPSKFSVASAEWMAERFQTALENLVGDPNSTLGQVATLSRRERDTLSTWGIRKSDFPNSETVHARFAEVARLRSRHEALVLEDDVWTYGELDRRANALAHRLAREIDVDGELVAVIGPRSMEQILAILAILKAGGAYLPLDPEFPDERLRLLIEESGATGVIACGGWSALNRDLGVPCVRPSEDFPAESDDPPSSSAGPDSPAYVMFTSGSTGRPKGVEVPHRAIMRLLFGNDYVELGPDRTLIHISPAAFDASTFEIWGSLLHGSRCVLYPERVPTPDRLGQIIRNYKVDTLWLTCSLFNFIIDEAPETLEPVRRLLTGGEALSGSHVERALKLLPGTRLINCYGPTETTTFASTHVVPPGYRAVHGPVPIGRPICNTSLVIVDQDDRLVPIGCEGELLIGGPGVALGYRNRPELTAEKFVKLADFGDERFYRSGDRVYWRPDGTIAFVGRVDDQVKIRGFRIELGEVESELRKIDGVRRAAVILVDEPPRGKLLQAAVVVEPGFEGEADLIRQQLAGNVPDFMVPAIIRVVDEIPLNPNGKVDRKRLGSLLRASTPAVGPLDSDQGFREPDRVLIDRLLEEVLGLDRVDESRSFFDLGGDSLSATRFATRFAQQLGRSIPISALFGASSIRETLELASGKFASGPQFGVPLPSHVDRGQFFPLTPKQESYLQLSRRNPGVPIVVIGRAFRIAGGIDRDAFSKAIDWLVARHEPLRTFLVTQPDGEVRQKLESASPPMIEFETRPEETVMSDELVINELDGQVSRGLDAFGGPVTRFRLIARGDIESILLLTTLHIATDGASLPVLLGDLFHAYTAYCSNRTPDRAQLNLQFLDFQDWFRRLLESPRGDELRRNWGERMRDLPIVHFRKRGGEKPGDHCHARMRYLKLDDGLGQAIRRFSLAQGITDFVTGLIGFKVLISRYIGSTDIMVGSSVNLKESASFDGAIGDFSNLIAIRSDLSGASDLASVAKRVVASFSDALQDRHLPKLEVRNMVPRAESILDDSYCPFAFTENPDLEFTVPSGLKIEAINQKERRFFFIFQANFSEVGSTFGFRFSYATEVFDQDLADSFISDYIEVLKCLTTDAKMRLEEIPWREKVPGILADVEVSESGTLRPLFLRLLREVLRIDSVDTAQSFMELGGDSLLAMRLVARVSGEVGAEIRPSDILGRISIEDIMASLGGRGDRASSRRKFEFESVDRSSLWPLGPKQEHYVDSIKTHPGEPVSVLGRAFQISGELIRDALQKAVDWLVERHESLRIVLVPTGEGQIVQKVLPCLPVTVEWVRFRGSDSGDEAILETLARYVREGIDAFGGPLLHLRVLESGPTDHCLLLKVLHTAIDGSHLSILTGDLADAYNSFLHNGPPALSLPTLQFLDFQVWRNRVLESDRNGEYKRFWNEEMFEVPAIGFPGFPSIDGFRSCQACIRYFDFPADLADELRTSARKIGVTPFAVGLAAYGALLKLYSGQDDFTIGTSLNLREDPRFDGAIGDFSNPIQIRIRVPANLRLRDVLDNSVRSLALVMDHRLYPAVEVRKMVPKGRSNFEDPINNFIFSEMRDIGERFDLSGCSIRQVEPRTRLLIALMSTNFMDTGKVMRVRTSYAPEAFSEETIERFFSDYFRLVGEIIKNPSDRLEAFRPSWPMAGCYSESPSASGILRSSTGLDAEWVGDADLSLVSDLVSMMTQVLGRDIESPGSSFFDLGGDSIGALRFLRQLRGRRGIDVDYVDFTRNPSAKGLARWIGDHQADLSAAASEPIPVTKAPKSEIMTREQTDAVLASLRKMENRRSDITRAFRVSSDLDLEAFERSLRYVIGRHQILRMEMRLRRDGRLARVYPRRVMLKLDEIDRSDIRIDSVDDTVESIHNDECLTGLDILNGPGYRFRVVHLPQNEKLLLITVSHGITDGISLVRLYGEIGEAYDAYAAGRVPRMKSPAVKAHDYGEWLKGWRDRNRTRLASYWSGIFEDGIPEERLPFDQPGDPNDRYLGRYIYLKLSPDLMKAVRSLAKQLGTTEFFVLLSAYFILINRTVGAGESVVTFVSDGRIHPDAEEVIGNFANAIPVRGKIRSDDRLVNLVCDLARQASNSLSHAGIPPGEILSTLESTGESPIPRLSAIAFNQVPDTYNSFSLRGVDVRPLRRKYFWRTNSIVALVFSDSDGSTTVQFCYPTELMRESAAQSFLNGFREVVRSVVDTPEALVSELPDFGGGAIVDPREDGLRSMFSAVLGVEVRRNESFFDFGGDSLIALRLLQRIRAVSPVSLSYEDLLGCPTPCDLAALLRKRENNQPAAKRIASVVEPSPLERLSRSRTWPATENQLVYRKIVTESGGQATGNIVRPMRVRGKFNPKNFAWAFRAVIDRHEALRTGLKKDAEGIVVQRIIRRFRVPVTIENRPGLSARKRQAECVRRADQEGKEPFELACPPLIRAKIVVFDHDDHLLVICVNHTVADGTSLGIIWSDLIEAYGALADGREPKLDELPFQYLDVSDWQRRFLREANEANLERFWRENLAGMSPGICYPLDGPLGKKRGRPGVILNHRFDATLTQKLRDLCQRHTCSLFCLSLASFKLVLRSIMGANDIAVSSAVDGRAHPEAANVVGHFANRVIVRTQFDDGASVIDTIETVKGNLARAVDHRQFPSAKAFGFVPKDENGRCEPDDFVFNQGPKAGRNLDLAGTEITPVTRKVARPNTILGMTWRDFGDDGMEAQLFYTPKLLKAASIDRFFKAWTAILEGIARDPRISVGELMTGVTEDQTEQGVGRTVREVFENVLGQIGVSAEKSFFELGGDSLSAVRVVTRLGSELGVEIPFDTLRRNPTIRSLADAIEIEASNLGEDRTRGTGVGSLGVKASSKSLGLSPHPIRKRRRPIKPEVQKIEFPEHGLTHGLGGYGTICRGFEADPSLDLKIFKKAYSWVINRHEALRVGFRRDDDEKVWRQVVDSVMPNFRVREIETDPSHSIDDVVHDWFEKESIRPLRMLARSLHRVNLLKFREERLFIFFTFCHRMIDGVGVERVFREIGLAYQSMVTGGLPDIEQPFLHDRDYSQWLSRWSARQYKELEAFWSDRFRDGIPESPVPLGFKDGSIPTGRSRLLGYTLDTDLVAGMRRLADANGTTVFFVHLATMALVFYRWKGLRDVLLNTAIDMRLSPEASDVVGNFVSAVPLRIRIDDSLGLDKFLIEVVKSATDALDHRGLDCRRYFKPILERDNRVDNPFGSCFCSQSPDTVSSLCLGATPLKPLSRPVMHGTHFACNIRPGGDGDLKFHFEYPENQFTSSDIGVLTEGYVQTVAAMVSSPDRIVRNLSAIVIDSVDSLAGHQEDLLSRVALLSDRGPVLLPETEAAGWKQNNLGKNRFPYSITRAFRLDGAFDPDIYHRALELVIGRHEALRVMHRCLENGGVERVILKDSNPKIRFVDLSDAGLEMALERARQIFDQESVEPLELTKGLPGRFCVVRISDTVHVVVLTFHHGLVDGIGLSIVFDELSVAYAAFSSGRQPRLSPVKVQSLDYSSWLKSWLEANSARLESFWKNVYREGIPKIQLPWKNVQITAGRVTGLLLRIELPADLMDRVEKRARYHGVSRFQFLYAGAFVMFARDPDADVTMISTITNARRHPDAETVVGTYIEGIPVIIRSLQGMQVGAAIEHIGTRVGEAISHSFPGAVGPGRQMLEKQGREDEPFGQVYFNQVPDIESAFHLEGLAIVPWNRKHILTRSNIGITARTLRDGSTVIQSTAPAALLSERDGARLLERYRDTITWMLDHPQREIDDTVDRIINVSVPTEHEEGVVGKQPDPDSTVARVTRIYEQLLGRPVGADLRFFAAGGNSLMAASLLHRLNRQFKVSLSFSQFERDLTARQLAEVIKSAARPVPMIESARSVRSDVDETNESLLPPLVPLPRPIPRTLIPEPPLGAVRTDYGARGIICRGFEVGKGFDLDVFERAFLSVVARHEALRRCFRRDHQGQVWCVVRDDPKLKVEVVDLGNLSDREANFRISEIYAAESRRHLKPFSGVMHRVKILRVGSDRTVVIFTFTHRFVDGISLVNILSETGRAYQALACGGEPSLPPVHIHEADYQEWLDRWEEANSPQLETFWRGVFRDGFPSRAFPPPKIGKGRRMVYGRFLNFSISARDMQKVRTFASSLGTTAHYVILSASYVFFNRWLGLDDILATSAADLRMLPEATDVVGNFVFNTPIRVRIAEGDSLDQVVERVTRIGREATAHRAPRLGLLIKKLLDEAGQAENPLGCFYFNQVTDTYGAFELGEIPVRPILREVTGGASFNSSHRFQRDGSAGFQVQFPIHLISAETFEPLLEDYRNILRAIIASPRTLVGNLQKIGQDTKLG